MSPAQLGPGCPPGHPGLRGRVWRTSQPRRHRRSRIRGKISVVEGEFSLKVDIELFIFPTASTLIKHVKLISQPC